MLNNFDLAFLNKVRAWFTNTIYANTAIIYNIAYNLADVDGSPESALQFPLISMYRPNGFSLDTTQTFAARRGGINFVKSEDNLQLTKARFITANLDYQLDIYTKSQEDLNDISVNLMQAFSLDPMLTVEQQDPESEEKYIESYDVTYESGPHEQSEFQHGDRIYHYSLVYKVVSARLITFSDVSLIRELRTNLNDIEERRYSTNLIFKDNVSVANSNNLYANIGKAFLDLYIVGSVYLDSHIEAIQSIEISAEGHTISFVSGGAITILPTGNVINDDSPFVIVNDEETTLLIVLKKE